MTFPEYAIEFNQKSKIDTEIRKTIKTKEKRPIIASSHWQKKGTTIFFHHDKIVEVKVPQIFLNKLAAVCDGHNTRTEIEGMLRQQWDFSSVKGFLDALEQNGILCDVSSVGDYWWKFVNNPTPFASNLSDAEILELVRRADKRNRKGGKGNSTPVTHSSLHCILEQRRSIRAFSEKCVEIDIVAQMLWAGYGIVKDPLCVDNDSPQQIKVWQKHSLARHTVPSAGALYPLRLSLVLFRSVGSYQAAIYDVCFRKHDLIELVPVTEKLLGAFQSFADQTVFNGAQGVIVISGSFAISGEKYGNRSLLYVPLEAGHVAQNIHLSAVENGVGTVEIGGFLEESLRHTLKLPKAFCPLTTILFGYPEAKKVKTKATADSFDVRWAAPITDGYHLPFSMAFARLKGDTGNDWACGRAGHPHIALAKAVSEAHEWIACGQIPSDMVRASMKELESAVDPRTIVRYHPRQYLRKHFVLKQFDEKQEYLWKEGMDFRTGKKVYILSDCIFFPYSPKTPHYTFANSSGTATYADTNTAKELAALELVERDAFMIAWLNRLTMPDILFSSLPAEFQRRIRALEHAGCSVVVKDFTLDLAPVMFVFAQHDGLPLTSCAACSSFNLVEAFGHALMEVEAAVYCRLCNGAPKPIRPKEAQFTDDHGNLYEQQKYFRRADFLMRKGTQRLLKKIGNGIPRNWPSFVALLKKKSLSLLTVELQAPQRLASGKTGMHTVKAFLPGLVPISFGYGLEPCGMGRLYRLPVELGYRRKPMTYGMLEKFLHPYT